MADAGLTHGGFYAHFPSKESLVREAILACAAESRRMLGQLVAEARADGHDPLEQIVRHYLTAVHRDRPDRGCSIAALGSEIARHPRKTRDVFTEGFEQLLAVVASALPDPSRPDARDVAYGVFSAMVGALQLSRTLTCPRQSQAALDAGVKAALALGRAGA
jgi:TetR/AcrR family transcriptional repressor of nem operon